MSGVRREGIEGVHDDVRYTEAFVYDGSNNLIYYGRTAPGNPKTLDTWQIVKMTYDGSNNMTDFQYANGDAGFTNIWNNYLLYVYS